MRDSAASLELTVGKGQMKPLEKPWRIQTTEGRAGRMKECSAVFGRTEG